ncbi:hypothetical protein FHS89_001933 [Rubricella aquisinus]|uniref:Uncharacterized protein n=1 Tax=Rubricella aquisinus TaxID=2028108 RepID=A0A840WPA8_9RHOB|nr:DUF6165 family protein [Rubricella aquisinus]MBB5515913.1 hypothetical protein [Rubricella aquisinus]
MVEVTAPCAASDLLDRLSILDLKRTRLRSDQDRALAGSAYQRLALARDAQLPDLSAAAEAIDALHQSNGLLWDLEEEMRRAHSGGTDAQIAALSRRIVAGNAQRARAKRRIDTILGSALVEVKDYTTGAGGSSGA